MSSKKKRRDAAADQVRRDYLRALGSNVDVALALLVHDIVSTGALGREEAAATVSVRAAGHLEFLAENSLDVSALEVAEWVADAVQEDLIEGHGDSPRLVVWPVCPSHPNHPLWLRRADEASRRAKIFVDDPVWTCMTTNRGIAELGRL